MKWLIGICAVMATMFTTAANAQTTVGGITFDDNAFADELVSAESIAGWVYGGGATSLEDALVGSNPDDYAYAFGSDSEVVLGFVDNAVINLAGDDLAVFELGTIESFLLAVTIDGATNLYSAVDTGYDAGGYDLLVATIDLDDFGVASNALVNTVQLFPDPFDVDPADFTVVGALNNVSLSCYPDLPDPELICNGWEDYVGSDGEDYTRYFLSFANWPEYPDELFEAAPDLPPCGDNPNASRTWVDIYEEDGDRIYGFCALGEAEDLTGIWFALPRGTPPECVYITLTDRRCEEVYTSNLVCPQWIDETGWAVGTRYLEKGNWAMYHEYNGEETVDLRADGGDGVGMLAGTVHFSAVSGDQVTITITLNEGWRFVDQDENVKIQDYASAPTKKAIPGKFDHKGYATESPFEIDVPANAYYGVHANLEWLDCVVVE
jgi:hypothetical protein